MSSAVYFVNVLFWLPSLCLARCLESIGTSLHHGSLRNVKVEGKDGSLRLVSLGWSSSRILTEIYKILVEEVLGFRTEHSVEVADSWRGVAALLGCLDFLSEDADWTCLVGDPQHVAFEIWDSYAESFLQTARTTYPQHVPAYLGSPGYEGKEMMFSKPEIFQNAWSQGEIALDYFKSYSMSRVDASSYFTNWSMLPSSVLLPCYELRTLLDEVSVQTYLRWSRDVDGTDLIEGRLASKCFNDFWWVAPACRESRDKCIPWITTNWYGAFEAMAKASAYGMPLMLATTSSANQQAIASNFNVLSYTWAPHDAFVNALDARVMFPDYDRAEWSQGNLRTAGLGQDLSKQAMRSLENFVPSAISLARAVSISLPTMQALIANLTLDQTSTLNSVACGWLLENHVLWKTWIPSATDCFKGQGLANVAASGAFVFAELRSAATTCSWCMPGRYSVPQIDDDGATAICKQCPPGKSQVEPTQSQCLFCPAGTYADVTGSTECKRCEIGRWTDSDNSSMCIPCLNGTTPYLGTISSRECVCSDGEYANIDGACSKCPEGMTCNFGSDARLFPWLDDNERSLANGLDYPKLEKGYWSKREAPLDVYKCENEGHGSCGGGLPGSSCIGGREGLLCARCPTGFYVDISDEQHYAVHCHECWALAAATIPMCVLVIWVIVLLTHWAANYYPLFVNATVDIVLFAGIGMMVLVLQICGIFRYTAVPWARSGPLSDILDFAAPYAGTSSFFGIDCIIGQSSLGHYALLMAIPWVLFVSTAAFYAGSHVMSRYWRYPGWSFSTTANTLGTIYNAIFITIANVAVSPASTYHHPNGKHSLVRYPEVISGSSMYIGHVAISCTIVIFPILPHASVCIWAVCTAPSIPPTKRSEFYSRFRFLLFPFRATDWWWGNALMFQKLLLAFVPALPNSEPHLQLSAVSLLSLSYVIGVVARRPWKPGILNAVDAAISSGFTIFGMLSAAFLDASGEGNQYGIFLITILAIMLACLLFAVFMAVMHLVRHPADGFSVPFEGTFAGFRDYAVPSSLAGDYHQTCAAVSVLTSESLQKLLRRMPVTDWYTISESISVWHALAPEVFPRPVLSQQRIVHIDHSGSYKKEQIKSRRSETMSNLADAFEKTSSRTSTPSSFTRSSIGVLRQQPEMTQSMASPDISAHSVSVSVQSEMVDNSANAVYVKQIMLL